MKKRVQHKAKLKEKKSSKRSKRNGSVVKAAELLRDVMNLLAVYKKEEKRGVTTRIDPDTADELKEKLEQLAKAL